MPSLCVKCCNILCKRNSSSGMISTGAGVVEGLRFVATSAIQTLCNTSGSLRTQGWPEQQQHRQHGCLVCFHHTITIPPSLTIASPTHATRLARSLFRAACSECALRPPLQQQLHVCVQQQTSGTHHSSTLYIRRGTSKIGVSHSFLGCGMIFYWKACLACSLPPWTTTGARWFRAVAAVRY